MSSKKITTYKEWMDIFDLFKQGENDYEVLELMQDGTLEWQAGVAERFINRLSNEVNERLTRVLETFQKRFSQARGDENQIVQSLLYLRKELQFLDKVVMIPALPEEIQNQFSGLIKEQRNSIQDSLIDSAKSDRSGKLSSLVRNHRI